MFFSNIRKRSGGFHAKSFFECILLSFGVYWGYITFVFPYLLQTSWLNTCLLVVALIIILNIGAVNHPDMYWDNEEYIMRKKTARMICIIEVAIIIICSLIGIAYGYILFMSFGVILSAIMLLVIALMLCTFPTNTANAASTLNGTYTSKAEAYNWGSYSANKSITMDMPDDKKEDGLRH